MAKRPLCVICSCFILLLLVLGQTQAAALLEERLPEKTVQALQTATSGRIYGQIYRIQPQEEGCTIYLKNTILLVRSNRYFLNNSKISYNQWPDVTIGDSVMASGKPSLAEAAGNPGQFDAAEYDAARHISVRMRARTLTVTKHKVSWIPETARRLRTCIRTEIERVLEPAEAGVLKTMLLGDKQDLETEVRQLYQKNGISHILAISGLHISVLGIGVYKMLRKKLMIRPAAAISGSLLFFYLILTDFPVSAQRAVYMFWLRLGAEVTGRTYDEPTAIAAAALLILGQNPLYGRDSGFLLSFGAACAVCMLKQCGISGHRFGLWLWLYMLPLTLTFYYEVSFSGLFLNLLVLKPLGMLLFLGLAGGILGSVLPVAGTLLLMPAEWLLKVYLLLCRLCARLPFCSVILGRPTLWQICIYSGGLTAWLLYRKKQKRRQGIKGPGQRTEKHKKVPVGTTDRNQWKLYADNTVICLLLATILLFRLPASVSVTMLDVGQGDGLVIRQGYRAILVDGGSTTVSKVGRYRIVPYLKYQGVRKVERIFLTHADADHINGLEEILEMIRDRELGVTVGGIIAPAWLQEKAESVKLFQLASKMDIPVSWATAGQSYLSGDIRFQILHPEKEAVYTTEGNAGSLTFRLETPAFSMLFTGDLEGQGEQEVCQKEIRCDILKVAHHGSRNASSECFLQRVGAKTALLSVGRGNTYGHPAKETLKRLQTVGCQSFTTEDCGALTVVEKQGGFCIEGYRRLQEREP